MSKLLRRTLILDTDPDALIILQHLLEEDGVDTTITWNEAEACQLLETVPFDVILIGDHPPELDAAAILDHLSFRGICPPVVILKGIVSEKDVEYYCRIGAAAVVAKRDRLSVFDQVRKTFAAKQFKAEQTKASVMEARTGRVA